MSYCNQNYSSNNGAGLVLFIILSPIIPAGLLGYWIGTSIYDIVIIRWGLALLFSGLDVFLYFMAIEKWGFWGFLGLYFGQWVLIDIINSLRMDTPLITLKIIEVLFSN